LAAGLTGFEVMGQFALSLVDKHCPHLRVPLWRDAPYCVLLENSSHDSEAHARHALEGVLEQALEQGHVSDAIVAENLAQADTLWHIRESIPLAQTQEGLNIKHDVSVAVSRIPAFVADATAALEAALPGIRVVNFGHLGDGNLHFNVQAPENTPPAVFLREQEDRVNTLVYDAVARAQGSISAEHGIGALKVDGLAHYKSPIALDLMARIKHALDPAQVLNPGRVVR
jgi:FAD/FMN-containing dehydrogenase